MKLLLPETLAQKCHEWLPTSTLRSAITQCRLGCVYVLDEWCFISFYIHETTFLRDWASSHAFVEGYTIRNRGILGMISRAGGHPLIKWLPLCPPCLPLVSYLLTGANCKQKLFVVWSSVVMIPALSHALISPPLPILSVGSNGFQMCPSCAKTL